MSMRKCILSFLALALAVPVPMCWASPIGCSATIFAPKAFANQSASHTASLSATGTFNCLHGNTNNCGFCLNWEIQVMQNGAWAHYGFIGADPWGQGCTSSQGFTWSGTCAGMPVGTYRFVVNFWTGNCGVYLVTPEYAQFNITG